MEIILKGIVSGCVLALLIGPVFFTLVQTSIERGFGSGAWVALGITLSDSLYITLIYLGLSQFFSDAGAHRYMAYAGGLILLGFGCYYLFFKSRRYTADYSITRIQSHNPIRLIGKGFLINGFSPLVLIFWLGTFSLATSELGYTRPYQVILYFGSIVVTVFLTDLIKAKLADQLRSWITARSIKILNIVLGLVMIFFGTRMIFYADDLLSL